MIVSDGIGGRGRLCIVFDLLLICRNDILQDCRYNGIVELIFWDSAVHAMAFVNSIGHGYPRRSQLFMCRVKYKWVVQAKTLSHKHKVGVRTRPVGGTKVGESPWINFLFTLVFLLFSFDQNKELLKTLVQILIVSSHSLIRNCSFLLNHVLRFKWRIIHDLYARHDCWLYNWLTCDND